MNLTDVLAHPLPSITALGPLRTRLLPRMSGRGRRDHVALTFDDGPDPASTPAFLELLARYRVKATFFLLGRMLAQAPDLGRDLVAAGHEVALHGWEHRCLIRRSPAATREDLQRGYDLIAEVTGRAPIFYRPPYGVLTASAARSARGLGMHTTLWTVWGADWTARATPDSVRRRVLRGLDGGGTILLHDSDCTAKPLAWRSTLGALPAILDTIAERGLHAGTLAEHGLLPVGDMATGPGTTA